MMDRDQSPANSDGEINYAESALIKDGYGRNGLISRADHKLVMHIASSIRS